MATVPDPEKHEWNHKEKQRGHLDGRCGMISRTYVVGGKLAVQSCEIHTENEGIVIHHDLSVGPVVWNGKLNSAPREKKRTSMELQFSEAEALVEMLLRFPEVRRLREMRASKEGQTDPGQEIAALGDGWVKHADHDEIPF